jgi:lipopolysaccharide transport system permease protein
MNDIRIISTKTESSSQYLKKLWNYRGLILAFAKRDLKIKYAQTYFGIFWVLLQPIPSVVFFSFFFGNLIHINTGALPYPIFALIGMIGWTYFTNLTSVVGNSLIESQYIIKKIYFPKLILPIAKVLTGAVDFMITFFLIVVAMVVFKVMPSYTIVFFPFFFLFNVLTGVSIGIWISALTFRFRDLQHVAPFVVNFGIWLTPVFYPATLLPQNLHYLMYFNPMAMVITGYRFSLAGDVVPDYYLLVSIIPVLIILVSGLLYFRKVEEEIADFI